MTQRLARLLVGRRNIWLLLSVLSCLVLGAGTGGSGFDTSLNVLLTRSDPYLQERDRMLAEFPALQEISFAFVPDSGDAFSPEALRALADLTIRFRELPYAQSISSILGWQSPFGDMLLFERSILELDTYTAEEINERRARALEDRFVAGSLLSPQADMAIATVRLNTTELRGAQSREVASATLALRESLQAQHPGVEIHASSESLFEYFNREAMISDLTLLLPIVLLLCNLVICYSFRSIALGLSILLLSGLTVILTVGTLGWAGRSFNSISVMAPLVVVTIAVADAVHIISLFRQGLSAGLSRVEAMTHSLYLNLRPVTLATITTAIGFASLNLASSPAISTFGTVVAIGVGYAWLLSLLALPGAILLLPERVVRSASREGGRDTPITLILRTCERLAHRRGNLLLALVGILGIVALAASFLNRTDFDRMSFISEDSPLHDYYEAVAERMERGPALSYGIDTQQEFGVLSPQFLQQVDRFSDWLRTQPDVLEVASLVEVIKTVNQVLSDNDPDAYLIPDDEDTIEQHLFDYRQVQARDFTLGNFATGDLSLLRLFVTTRPLSNQQIIDLDAQIKSVFDGMFADGAQATLLHGSSTLLFARMDEAVTVELLQGFAFSLLLITVTLIIGMRSFYYGMLSVLPNLLPATFVFGAWGLLVGQIDPFVMMLFSISIGLVVDDTVHVLSTYQTSRAGGQTSEQAVASALHKAGPALIITTSVLALGTLVMIAASTLYFQQAATLLVPIVVLALVLDLTFFPALLMRCDRKPHRSGPLP